MSAHRPGGSPRLSTAACIAAREREAEELSDALGNVRAAQIERAKI
jgi:hypothetical protein